MNEIGHLALLRQMFPDKFVLDIGEVAMVLGCSKKRLYTLSSKKELPFATLPGFRIQVTLMELARYLDEASEPTGVDEIVRPGEKGCVKTGDVQEAEELPGKKRKVGRPRKIDSVLNYRGRS